MVFTKDLYTLYELLYLLTPESDHHGFTNALYALYELLYLLTPESDHHGFTNALYAPYELLYLLTPEKTMVLLTLSMPFMNSCIY